jgi:glucan 1,6-alpha-glucosidase
MRVNPNYRQINAAAQTGDPDSVFSAYRELIRLRKEYPVIEKGGFELLLPEHDAVFAYRRSGCGELLVVVNFFGTTIPDPLMQEEAGMKVLYRNYANEGKEGMLRPYEAVWYYSGLE